MELASHIIYLSFDSDFFIAARGGSITIGLTSFLEGEVSFLKKKSFIIPIHQLEKFWLLVEALIRNGGFAFPLDKGSPPAEAYCLQLEDTTIAAEKDILYVNYGSEDSFKIQFDLEKFHRFVSVLKDVLLFSLSPRKQTHKDIEKIVTSLQKFPSRTADIEEIKDMLDKIFVSKVSQQKKFIRQQFILKNMSVVQVYYKMVKIVDVPK